MLVLIAASPLAQAQSMAILKWAGVDKPSINGEIIVTPSEVNRIVASHDVVYAVDTANSRVHRSNNGGLTFTDITNTLPAGVLPAQEIAVAPDRPQYVAIVTDNRTKVYISNDSGATWTDTDLPTTITGTIQCIAISNGYRVASDLVHDVAIGTADWGDVTNTTTGQIWVLQVGASFGGWKNQNLTFALAPGAEVSAIAFSSSYNSDSTILAVASDNNTTSLCIGLRDLSASATTWNGLYIPGYPVQIGSLLGDSDNVTDIVSSIALPSDYVGTSSTSRKVLVSCYRELNYVPMTGPTNSGIYRLDDATSQYPLLSDIAISNIAYFGTLQTGKLIAGDATTTTYTTQVRRLADPFYATPPPTSWQTASQPPSGPGNAQVAWSYSGTVAFCGTGQIPPPPIPPYDESAFSQSLDNGNTWVQTSLINTDIHISDIAPAPDSKSLFMATYSDFGPEGVWRSAGEPLGTYWGRLLAMETTSSRVILRLSPDYATDYTIYVAEVNSGSSSSLMAVSHNRGNTWQKLYGPAGIIDMAVEDPNTFYVALPGGYIRKNSNAGTAWLSPPVSCFPDSASEISMLTVFDKGDILAGSRDSKVSYSTDNGTSFTEIDRPIGSHAGDVQVVADANYDKNKLIYATDNVTDDGIWRWTVGTSTEWEQVDKPITDRGTGQRFCGLAMGKEGTLYALCSDNVTSTDHGGGMDRFLNPSEPYVWNIEFDVINHTLPVGTIFDPTTIDTTIIPNVPIFPNTMPSLKLASDTNHNVAWAVDFANMLIYRFDDNICKVGPATNSPDTVGCDPVSGRNQEVNLDWEQLSLSNQYEIQIAKDDQFSIQVVSSDNVTPVDLTSPAVFFPAGGAVTTPASEIANWGNFECGHTYYWRVRTRHAVTTEVIRSPWSEVRSFTVKTGLPVRADYYGIKLLSPDNGCIGCPVKSASFSWSPFKETAKYKFVLAKDAAMTQVVAEAMVATTAYEYEGTLDYSINYFWRVMALEPAPSDWSATFSFQTQRVPAAPTPSAPTFETPFWVWVIFAIGAILMTNLLILVLRRLAEV